MSEELKPSQYLDAVLRPLLEKPDALRIFSKDDERGTLLTLEVEPSDMGHVIGKNGETAKSFRRLVRQFGMSREVKISIRIVDPQDETSEAEDEE